jgi:toxin ParE1/3/4
MRVLWTDQAFARLAEIEDYIGADSPARAQRFVAKLIERASLLARTPRIGRAVPELPESKLRELIEGNYRIVYRVHGKTVQILTVFERHRRFPADDLPESK